MSRSQPAHIPIGFLFLLWVALIQHAESLCNLIQHYRTTVERWNFVVKARLHSRLLLSETTSVEPSSPSSSSFSLQGTSSSSPEPITTFPRLSRVGGRSQVVSIRSSGLTGALSSGPEQEVAIRFGPEHKLVAVTGETGSGKSLLVAKALEFVLGGKSLSSSLLRNNGNNGEPSAPAGGVNATSAVAWVQLELRLDDEHRDEAQVLLRQLGLDDSLLQSDAAPANLILTRTLIQQNSSYSSKQQQPRLKSLCQINGQSVPLKTLALVARPLVAVVDAAAAANALSGPEIRLAIIDSAVPGEVLASAARAKQHYRSCRKHREALQSQQRNEILPRSFSRDSAQDLKLLDHWVDELNVFENRVMKFCRSFPEEDSDQSGLGIASQALANTAWMDSTSTTNQPFASALFVTLSNLRDAILSLEDQIRSAQLCADALSSLSSPQSALTAVERARRLLVESVVQESRSQGRITQAAEKSHQLLNDLETALSACVRFIEDDDRGLLQSLQAARSRCPISVDEINEIIIEWNTLSRKHGISPFTLPCCHESLKKERDGGFQTREQLAAAITQEEHARKAWEEAAQALTLARRRVAHELSESVTKQLPALGMERSKFRVDVKAPSARFDPAADLSMSQRGADEIDFVLLHRQSSLSRNLEEQGGKVSEVASSGEKARILLAIECSLPGSVGISCGDTRVDESLTTEMVLPRLPPVAVVYDEIDAHVGGNAAVAVSAMLSDQSVLKQVVAITHSPTIAAGADAHVVIRRRSPNDAHIQVDCRVVDGVDRRKELGRMASGDMAVEEAEMFADALIRDASQRKTLRSSSKHSL